MKVNISDVQVLKGEVQTAQTEIKRQVRMAETITRKVEQSEVKMKKIDSKLD